ncbi:MAG: endolytic transglycosylase MltG, partial [Clostridiales bacterium]
MYNKKPVRHNKVNSPTEKQNISARSNPRSKSVKKKKHNNSSGRFLLLLVIVLLFSGFFYWQSLDNSVQLAKKVQITIAEGSSSDQIGDALKESGLIRSKMAFKNYLRKENIAQKLRPGTYVFSGELVFEDITAQLLRGKSTDDIKVTIPEGLTM